MMRWISAGSLVGLLALGAVACGSNQDPAADKAATESNSSTTVSAAQGGSGASPKADELTAMAQDLVAQLDKAVSAGIGSGKPPTAQELEALLKAQMDQLTIPTTTTKRP